MADPRYSNPYRRKFELGEAFFIPGPDGDSLLEVVDGYRRPLAGKKNQKFYVVDHTSPQHPGFRHRLTPTHEALAFILLEFGFFPPQGKQHSEP